MSVRSGVGVPPATATELQYHLRKAQISLLPKATISRTNSCISLTLPCGSHPEYAHTVYKNALNECSFIRLRALHAKQQADNLAELWQEFLSVYELIAQILCAVGM